MKIKRKKESDPQLTYFHVKSDYNLSKQVDKISKANRWRRKNSLKMGFFFIQITHYSKHIEVYEECRQKHKKALEIKTD